MPELHDLLERRASGYGPPADLFERVVDRRRRRDRTRRVAAGVLGIAVFALAAIGFVRLLGSEGTPAGDPRSPFLGTWELFAHGSQHTLEIRVSGDAIYEVALFDEGATVCDGLPAREMGVGTLASSTEMTVTSQVITCEDGTVLEDVPPITYTYDSQTDTLSDSSGEVWHRPGSDPDVTPSGGMWPQTSLDEVRQAQELADAGDPRYTWQVDPGLELERAWREGPYDAELLARFLREELSWEEFQSIPGFDFGRGYSKVDFIRCAPGRTNPVYPNDPSGGGCAPTLDEFRYETVRIDMAQPGLQGATGIWVVTRWEMIEPFEQVVPPSEAETTSLLEAFLQARIDGEGAGEYVDAQAPWWDEYPFLYGGDEIPFLYATPTGAPYERSEFDVAEGPLWPDGRMRIKVRLFAENGQTVVEQFFQMDRVDRGLWYEDQSDGSDGPGTTVNGHDVPVPYSLFDGEVTLYMTYPWHAEFSDDEGSRFNLISGDFEGALQLLGPRPVRNGCQQGPTPTHAQALARAIRSNPDLEATAPVTVSVGGIEGLRMDVVAAPGTINCAEGETPKVAEVALSSGYRMRLFLLDLSEGLSARILAIAISAPGDRFEAALEAATPIVDSIEFHAP